VNESAYNLANFLSMKYARNTLALSLIHLIVSIIGKPEKHSITEVLGFVEQEKAYFLSCSIDL
jgi:hypothetical protein